MNVNHKAELLKRIWQRLGISLLFTGITAGFLFAAARGIGTIGPAAYRFVLPAGFVLMILMPFILLNRDGRRRVGFVKSSSGKYYLLALAAGAGLALLCYGTGMMFYGTSPDNWFISIKNSYFNTFDTSGKSVLQLFIIFTFPALLFSPFGEEIFFRGFLQEAISTKLFYGRAMVVDSLFFALIHLFHHGFVKDSAGVIRFYPLSGAIWVLLMFATAMVFAILKMKSRSIYPAIVAHAIFNLVMNVAIFYWM
jgi:uncharacterized protein